MGRSRVGAVIVNFNAGDDLTRSVASLKADGVVDVVVADNGSTDDSLATLARAFPDVPVDHLSNPGYGAGMNHGARRLDNEVLFVVNPDAAITPGCVAQLLSRFDADPTLALLGPRIVDEDGHLYPSARVFPSLALGLGHAMLGMFWRTNPFSAKYKMLDWGQSTYRDIDWVSGALMFVRRKAFDDVGGFDDGFWLYMEDVDLCKRLWEAGWKVAYDPDAHALHAGGTGTVKTARPFKFVAAHQKSFLRYFRKHASGIDRLLYPLAVVGFGLRLPIAWLSATLRGRH